MWGLSRGCVAEQRPRPRLRLGGVYWFELYFYCFLCWCWQELVLPLWGFFIWASNRKMRQMVMLESTGSFDLCTMYIKGTLIWNTIGRWCDISIKKHWTWKTYNCNKLSAVTYLGRDAYRCSGSKKVCTGVSVLSLNMPILQCTDIAAWANKTESQVSRTPLGKSVKPSQSTSCHIYSMEKVSPGRGGICALFWTKNTYACPGSVTLDSPRLGTRLWRVAFWPLLEGYENEAHPIKQRQKRLSGYGHCVALDCVFLFFLEIARSLQTLLCVRE